MDMLGGTAMGQDERTIKVLRQHDADCALPWELLDGEMWNIASKSS